MIDALQREWKRKSIKRNQIVLFAVICIGPGLDAISSNEKTKTSANNAQFIKCCIFTTVD